MNAQSEGEQEQGGGGYRGGEKRQSKVVSTSLRILRGSDWHITASGKAAAPSAAVVLRLGNGRMGSISFFVFGLVSACRQAGRCFTSLVW